ncbi:MAG: hypothetical protein GMKNLPBB_00021 [Myxococcota bacterium]|nr:hypothetical protein [Myxococcota bacterium]
MRGRAMFNAKSALGLLALTLIFGSCAEKRPEITYVQPNALSKSIFQGEWYMEYTLTDVPSTVGYGFVGARTGLEKVRWEIQEGHLIAYRTWENIPGLENKKERGPEFKSAPVAIYAIDSHFDIRRQYNPITGEELNVFEENARDRPWYQRDYFRVDWSRNLNEDMSFTRGLGSFGQGVNYYIQPHELDNPDRPVISDNYIDITSKFTIYPDIYSCVFSFYAFDCGPSEIKVRASFMKIDRPRNYEPMEYPDFVPLTNNGKLVYERWDPGLQNYRACTPADPAAECEMVTVKVFERFGFFRTERPVYDRQRGFLESSRRYLINRWNIWEKSYDENGVLIPMNQRVVKPVVYYTNVDYPDNLMDITKEMVAEWNNAFKETIRNYQYGSNIPDVFVLRQNDCNMNNVRAYMGKHSEYAGEVARRVAPADKLTPANLERACSTLMAVSHANPAETDKFTYQRNGDLRFSFIYWVNNFQVSGPLGYGPSSTDPDTGEIVSGNAYVYGASVDTYATSSADIIRAMNGDITPNDLLSGDYVSRYIQGNREKSMAHMANHPVDANPQFVDAIERRFARLGSTREELTPKGAANEGFARLESIRGSRLERELLVTPDIAMAFGGAGRKPTDPITDDVVKRASPASWAGANKHPDYYNRIRQLTAGNNGCIYAADFADDAVVGLALEFKNKGLTVEQIIARLREQIYKGVMLHEIGHTLGLRHNFEGSADAMNYHDKYWEIRNKSTDPKERAAMKQREFQYSTIMDYGAKFNSDFQGIGHYDRAAIKFGYGRIIEEFAHDRIPTGGTWEGFQFQYSPNTLVDRLLGGNDPAQGVQNLRARRDIPFDNYVEELKAAYAKGRFDYETVFNKAVPYRFCSDEYAGSFLTCNRWDEGSTVSEIVSNAIDTYRNYYLFTNFKRDRQNFALDGISSYIARLYDRHFRYFAQSFQYLYFFRLIYGNSILRTELGKEFMKASTDGLNLLGEIMQMPEPGRYCLYNENNDNVFLPDYYFGGSCGARQSVNVPVGMGRYFQIDFTNNYDYRISRIGSLYDKIVAIQALVDTNSPFLRLDVGSDLGLYSINFYRLYKPEILDFFDGLIGNNFQKYAGVVDKGEYRPRLIIDAANAAPGKENLGQDLAKLPYLQPPSTYTINYYALLFGMAFFTSTQDRVLDFSKYLKVSQKGGNDDVDYNTVPEDRRIEFTEPVSGLTYRAVQTADGKGIAYNLVKEAKRRYEKIYLPAKQELDKTPANDRTRPDKEDTFFRAERSLSNIVELMDTVRLFYREFEFNQ